MVPDLEWIINWGQQSPITVMLVMFSKGIQHSLVSWEMTEDLDGIELYQVVTVRNVAFDNFRLLYKIVIFQSLSFKIQPRSAAWALRFHGILNVTFNKEALRNSTYILSYLYRCEPGIGELSQSTGIYLFCLLCIFRTSLTQLDNVIMCYFFKNLK